MSYRKSKLARLFATLIAPSAALGVGLVDAHAAEITKFTDKSFIEALTKTKQLAEREVDGGAVVRIILKWEDGECDPNREAVTCPHSQLLILTINAPGDLYPDIGTWRTDRKIRWEFVRWLNADNPTPTDVTSFEATACEAPPEVESGKVDPRKGGWWQKVTYRVDVGSNAPSIHALTKRADGARCDLY
jgi:hypothetical protein